MVKSHNEKNPENTDMACQKPESIIFKLKFKYLKRYIYTPYLLRIQEQKLKNN